MSISQFEHARILGISSLIPMFLPALYEIKKEEILVHFITGCLKLGDWVYKIWEYPLTLGKISIS